MPASSPFSPRGRAGCGDADPRPQQPRPGCQPSSAASPTGGKSPPASGPAATTPRPTGCSGELAGSFAGGWDYKTGLGTSNNKSIASVSKGYVNDRPDAGRRFQRDHQPVRCARPAAGQAAIDAAQVSDADADRQGPCRLHRLQGHQELMQMSGGAMGFALRRRGAQRKSPASRATEHHPPRWAASASIRTATPRATARSMRPSSS